MNKAELIKVVAEKAEFAKPDAEKAVKAVFEAIFETLQNGTDVKIAGFGNFKVAVSPARAEREGRNPSTGEKMIIKAKPESKKVKFAPAKPLKEAVAGQ